MNNPHTIFEIENGIATVTFNRPKAMNALNAALITEFSGVLDGIGQDESIRVLILTGAGDKAFVAGADINELAEFDPLKGKHFSTLGQTAIGKLQNLSIPVIAAVNGYALGGGSEIALACDFIYASENAMFGLPEITLGLIPGFGGTQRLPRLVGLNMAKELIFTGRMMTATEAEKIGMVNRVLPSEALMAAVKKTAAAIAKKGKVSLRAAKQAINASMNVDLITGCAIESDAFSLCLASVDAKEGTAAFLEKRNAEFKGGYME
jgi:enoyl-CoA hydratase